MPRPAQEFCPPRDGCSRRRTSTGPGSLLTFGLLTAVALAASGCSPTSDAAPAAPAAAATEEVPSVVFRGPFEQRILLTGELVAEDGINLSTPNANIWPVPVRWVVEDGTVLKEGDPVVEFDNSQIAGNLESLHSQVVEASNALISTRSAVDNRISQAFFTREQKKADFEKAQIEADLPQGITANQEFQRRRLEMEKARLELEDAERRLASEKQSGAKEVEVQRLALEKAKRRVQRVEESIELLTLKAPRDGIVLVQTNPMVGRLFQTGDNSFPGTNVASFPKLDTMMVEAFLFDVDDGKIQPGDRLDATLDTFPEWPLEGTVREVSPLADTVDPKSLRRTFKVRIDLDTVDTERMRPGMSVKVEVRRNSEGDQLLIPRRALWLDGSRTMARLDDGSDQEVTVSDCDATVCVLVSGLEQGARLGARPLGATS